MTGKNILYMTYRSPYARKVRVVMLEKKIPFDEVSVDFAEKPAALLKANPFGSIPTLVASDGTVLSDSTLILHYLEEVFPDYSLVTKNVPDRWQIWNWEELSDRLCDSGVAVFHATSDEKQLEAKRAKMQHTAEMVLALAEAALQKKNYLAGEYSLADIALATTIEWMRFRLDFKLSDDLTHVKDWLARLGERETFKNTMPRLGM